MREWLFVLLLTVSCAVVAQAPVEDRRPARDDVGAAQRRVEFTRQALDRADADLRDATAVHRDVRKRFDEVRVQLDQAEKAVARAQAAAADARKNYDRESADLTRRRDAKGS